MRAARRHTAGSAESLPERSCCHIHAGNMFHVRMSLKKTVDFPEMMLILSLGNILFQQALHTEQALRVPWRAPNGPGPPSGDS